MAQPRSTSDTLLISVDGEPAITWAEFVTLNDTLDPAEFDVIADDLARDGIHHGGGGAEAEYMIRIATAPQHFTHDLTLRLPRYPDRPVAATATIGVDGAGIPDAVKVRFFLPDGGLLDVVRGDAFDRARDELRDRHHAAIRARAAGMRAVAAAVDQPISWFALADA